MNYPVFIYAVYIICGFSFCLGSLSDQQLMRMKDMALKIDDVRTLYALGKALFDIDREIRQGTFKIQAAVQPKDWGSLLYSYYMAVTYLAGIRGLIARSRIVKLFDPRYGSMGVAQIEKMFRAPGLMSHV